MIEIDNILDVEKHLDSIELVIFDLDDTLYSEMDYVKSGFKCIAERFNEMPNLYDKLLESFNNKEAAIDTVFKKHNMMSYKDEALKIYRTHIPNISLYPGVKEMLLRIKKTKKLGLITDGRPEGQHAKIEALTIKDIFDKIIITDELGGIEFRKPNEKAFVMMCNELSFSYSKSLYVGDNLKKDFVATKKLHMNFIYFNNKEGLYCALKK